MTTENKIEKLRAIDELHVQDEGANRWSIFCDVPMSEFDWMALLEGLDLRSLSLKTTHLTERVAITYIPKIRSIQSLNLSTNLDLDGVFLMSLPDTYPTEVIDVTRTSMRDLALEQFVRLKNIKCVFANKTQFSDKAMAAIPVTRELEVRFFD